jgi:hypothetical protein
MPLQWPTWALQWPTSGEDGRKWSRRWFVPNAINAWARRHPDVAKAVEELGRIEGFWRAVVGLEHLEEHRVRLLVTASLERPEVYEKPTVQINLGNEHPIAARIVCIVALNGPDAPIDAESNRRHRAAHGPAQRAKAQDPLLAIQTIRRLRSQELKNSEGIPLRRRLLEAIRDEVAYRTPRQSSPAFTDMSGAELMRVVQEAESLVRAVRKDPTTFWPLLPNEVAWIDRPPPIRHFPSDYKERLKDPDDAEGMRPAGVLAHDLTLLRLGYDPEDPKARSSLKTDLSRARQKK